MEVTTTSVDFMLGIYNVQFAQQVRTGLGELVKKYCYGCEVDHPSQTHHTCLMWTELEHLDAYFEEALETVDRKAVTDMCTAELKSMEGSYRTNVQVNIDETARRNFFTLLESVEWCKKNLPKPDRVYKDVKKIILLDRLNGFEGLEI